MSSSIVRFWWVLKFSTFDLEIRDTIYFLHWIFLGVCVYLWEEIQYPFSFTFSCTHTAPPFRIRELSPAFPPLSGQGRILLVRQLTLLWYQYCPVETHPKAVVWNNSLLFCSQIQGFLSSARPSSFRFPLRLPARQKAGCFRWHWPGRFTQLGLLSSPFRWFLHRMASEEQDSCGGLSVAKCGLFCCASERTSLMP